MTPRTLTLTVSPEQAGRTVKSLLRRNLGVSDGMLARLRQRPDGILCNGSPIRTIDRVQAGDTLAVQVGDTRQGFRFEPMDVSLHILFEDDDLLVLDKPAGMAVHGRSDHGEPTVANALAYHLGADAVFHPVNRLDRGTSGVMAVAKSGYVHDRLRCALHTAAFQRTYLAAAEGAVTPPDGVIDLPVARETPGGIRRVVREDGAEAATEYRTLCVENGRTLLRVVPRTGRTHQIRVHFAAISHPLVGDWLYGTESADIARPALHSHALAFTHPVTGVRLRFTAPVPDDLRGLFSQFAMQEDL